MNEDIHIEGEHLLIPRKRGGFIKWPVHMIWEAGFEYWWRNVPERGVGNERLTDVYRALLPK